MANQLLYSSWICNNSFNYKKVSLLSFYEKFKYMFHKNMWTRLSLTYNCHGLLLLMFHDDDEKYPLSLFLLIKMGAWLLLMCIIYTWFMVCQSLLRFSINDQSFVQMHFVASLFTFISVKIVYHQSQ